MHCTSNYPIPAERDTFFAGGATGSWAALHGRFHLAWQADQTDTAGTARGDAVCARSASTSGRSVATASPRPTAGCKTPENQASNELPGKDNEEMGCLQAAWGYVRPGERCWGPADERVRRRLPQPRWDMSFHLA